MIQRNQYVIQPYKVGQKDRKSLVIGIPAALAKEFNIDRNTIFILKPEKTNRLILDKISYDENKETNDKEISIDKSLKPSSQQISGQDH